jgi:signal transduction histidine kinase
MDDFVAELDQCDEEGEDVARYPNSGTRDERQLKRRLSPLRITLIYLIVGALWILFSDRLLAALTDDPAVLTRLGTFKGWFYVLATAGLLYLLMRRADEALERRVEERTHELATLLTVSHTVASTLELEPLLKLILEQLQSVVDYTGASVMIREGEELVLRAHHGPFSQAEAFAMRSHVGQPLARDVVLNHKTVVICDTLDETPPARNFRVWAGEHVKARPGIDLDKILSSIRSWVGVPLIVKGTAIGVLTLSYSEPDRYSPRDAALVRAFADQVAVAIENARLHAQAERLAVVEERQRLARELHDSVTQALYSVNLYAEAARRAIEFGKQEAALKNLEQARNMAREAVVDMRLLIFELRPPVLEEEGLAAALQARLDSVETRAGLQTAMQVEGERRLPPVVEEELFWIAQEALNNVVKHAQARGVTVRLELGDEEVRLEVRDDGVGFELTEAERSGGVGLRSLQERAARIAGELVIESAPGEGTSVKVRARVPQTQEEER